MLVAEIDFPAPGDPRPLTFLGSLSISLKKASRAPFIHGSQRASSPRALTRSSNFSSSAIFTSFTRMVDTTNQIIQIMGTETSPCSGRISTRSAVFCPSSDQACSVIHLICLFEQGCTWLRPGKRVYPGCWILARSWSLSMLWYEDSVFESTRYQTWFIWDGAHHIFHTIRTCWSCWSGRLYILYLWGPVRIIA